MSAVPPWAWALLLAGATSVALAAAWWRSRQQVAQLERLVTAGDERLEHLQLQFERFVPPEVVERLTAGGGRLAPQRQQVTMLFADLRGFTAMCDALDPAVTVSVLNDYFSSMQRAVEAHHGHVNELVGDGLLALFGALERNAWQARDAVLAALDMRAALARYNQTLQEKGLPLLRFGIGILNRPGI